MVCERCYGKGDRGSIGVMICPECQGSGIVSCCDTAGANGAENKSPVEYWAEEIAKAIANLTTLNGA